MPRFTIRDVLWLTVVAAVLVAWLLDHREQARDRATSEAFMLRFTPDGY